MGRKSAVNKASVAGNTLSGSQPRPPCGICDNESSAADMFQCKTCDVCFHPVCVDITPDAFRVVKPFLSSVGWVCRECIDIIRDKRKSLALELATVFASLQTLLHEYQALVKRVDELSVKPVVPAPAAVENVVQDHIRYTKNIIVSGLAEVPGMTDAEVVTSYCETHLICKPWVDVNR